MKSLLTNLAMASLLALSSTLSKADTNLITNGGFETGDLTGFTVTGNTGFTGVGTFGGPGGIGPDTGDYYAFLGAVGSLDYLSQTIDTTLGDTYTLNFYLGNDGDIPNEFSTAIGGVTVFDQTDIPGEPYTKYGFTFDATGSTTEITFGSENGPGYLSLDDISVFAGVPEPTTWSLAALSIGTLFLARRRLGLQS